jgi:hypothetical protein
MDACAESQSTEVKTSGPRADSAEQLAYTGRDESISWLPFGQARQIKSRKWVKTSGFSRGQMSLL